MERLQSDTEKILAISQSMIQPNHPYHGFTHGNRGTLIVNPKRQNIDMLAELRRFYEEFYSANVMCLCVSGGILWDCNKGEPSGLICDLILRQENNIFVGRSLVMVTVNQGLKDCIFR